MWDVLCLTLLLDINIKKKWILFLTYILKIFILNQINENEREKNRGAQLVVKMQGKTTILVDPANPKSQPKKFEYDHSYWSHNGFKVNDNGYCEPTSTKYCDQVRQPTISKR